MRFIVLILFILLFANADDGLNVEIDIGHNSNNKGSYSSNCVGEFEYNMELGNYIKNNNLNRDIQININNDFNKNISFSDRYKSSLNKDIFLSIHHDSVQLEDIYNKNEKCYKTNAASGVSIFISKKNKYLKESAIFAQIVGHELIKNGFKINSYHNKNINGEKKVFFNKEYGVYWYDDLLVLKNSHAPAVLIESGVIVNPEEENNIKRDSYKKRFNKAIGDSLNIYKNYLKK